MHFLPIELPDCGGGQIFSADGKFVPIHLGRFGRQSEPSVANYLKAVVWNEIILYVTMTTNKK
jgi:hypothetical protein